MIAQAGHKIRIFALTITMLGLIAGCGSQAVRAPVADRPSGSPTKTASLGEKAVAVALQQVGVPYRYGGNSRSGFDCSGLIQYSYLQVGKPIPRTTARLWSSTETISRSNLKVGDLLFFNIEGKMSHVGLYIGSQRFVHAPSTGRTVSVASLASPFYSAALARAGRPRF